MWLILITHLSSFFSLFSLLFFLGFFVCICIYVSSLSLPWYSWIWGLWAFWERWELDKGCVKRVFLELNSYRGYHSSWGFLVSQPPFHPDTSAAIPPGRHPIFSRCLTTAILSDRRSTFSAYFTPGACRWMEEEDDSTSNWAYKSRCLLSWSIWQLNTLAVNWSLLSKISRLHFMATLLYTPSPLFASLIGNLLF